VNICVAGLWHLGSVTAACLAARGHRVVGYDADPSTVSELASCRPPILEPGLAELVAAGLASGHLRFTTEPADALSGVDVLWIAYDTPVDDDDRADVDNVLAHIRHLLAFVPDGATVLVSSQVVAGTTRRLAEEAHQARPDATIGWAYSPENLRLGAAIAAFQSAERIVVGVDDDATRARLEPLVDTLAERVEWMSVPSAEMTKHALNAFLATSVTFINEVARVAELVDADASEVERGLKSEARIGPRAYLRPGAAIAGGTLARDVVFLGELGRAGAVETPLLASIIASNRAHTRWPEHALERLLGDLSGATIAVWGLTYKADTSTLRRSAALELCRALTARGAHVRAFDPAVARLPAADAGAAELAGSALAAVRDAQALVVMTPWPEFAEVAAQDVASAMAAPVVVDPAGAVSATLGRDASIRYVTVGVWRS
jgi:UDPglucose 6-dehydrogenase